MHFENITGRRRLATSFRMRVDYLFITLGSTACKVYLIDRSGTALRKCCKCQTRGMRPSISGKIWTDNNAPASVRLSEGWRFYAGHVSLCESKISYEKNHYFSSLHRDRHLY